MPVLDRPFTLYTDFQGDCIAAVLEQLGTDNKQHVIAYASKQCPSSPAKLGSTDGELLAILFGIEKFHHYLSAVPFTLVTDHGALVHLNSGKNSNAKFARYALRLAPYDFRVRHRKGTAHANADGLSRAAKELSSTIPLTLDCAMAAEDTQADPHDVTMLTWTADS